MNTPFGGGADGFVLSAFLFFTPYGSAYYASKNKYSAQNHNKAQIIAVSSFPAGRFRDR